MCTNPEDINAKVADFISLSGSWDTEKLKGSVFDMDLGIIQNIPINTNLMDQPIWHYDKVGRYSVKSGYKLFMNSLINEASSSSNHMEKVWNNIWKMCVPNKIRLFCWKALNNFIPTNLNLKIRGIDSSIYCPICFKYPESTDHIYSLFTCERAMEIWKNM